MLLLDTHVLLWWLEDPRKLDPKAAEAIRLAGEKVWVSVASIWEMEVKRAAGRLHTPDNLTEVLVEEGFGILPIMAEHALKIRELAPIHADPFDRMLVCQAMVEGLKIVTRDEHICRYDVACIRA